MQKTAAEIADYVLFKIAIDEALEKEAIFGMGGNWPHVWQRVAERVALANRPFVKKIIEASAKNLSKAPQKEWYRPVYDRVTKDLLGYIVGQGKWISSLKAPHMKPYGVKW